MADRHRTPRSGNHMPHIHRTMPRMQLENFFDGSRANRSGERSRQNCPRPPANNALACPVRVRCFAMHRVLLALPSAPVGSKGHAEKIPAQHPQDRRLDLPGRCSRPGRNVQRLHCAVPIQHKFHGPQMPARARESRGDHIRMEFPGRFAEKGGQFHWRLLSMPGVTLGSPRLGRLPTILRAPLAFPRRQREFGNGRVSEVDPDCSAD